MLLDQFKEETRRKDEKVSSEYQLQLQDALTKNQRLEAELAMAKGRLEEAMKGGESQQGTREVAHLFFFFLSC